MAIKLDEARVRLLKIGASLMLKSDNEGGNLRLYAPNSSTNCYEWDVYDGNLRLYYSTTNGDNATASWHFKTNGELHSAKFVGALNGNADTATNFNSARTITLVGDVTGSASSNGASGWSITTTVGNDSHTHSYIIDNGNHNEVASGTTANAPTAGMLKTSGLYMTRTYNDSNTPANFGNIINLAGVGTGQLLCEWSVADNTPGHLYYRSHRDTSTGGWSSWVTILDSSNYTDWCDDRYVNISGDTMNGTIWSTHIYPKATMTYNLGSESNAYESIFSRVMYVRHIEPAKYINNDLYLNYYSQDGCVKVYSQMSMEGLSNIVNLPIGGGIFWNPYVESATDSTDAASITLHANGVGGGTELRISMENDGDDVINLNPAAWIYLKGKATFRVEDNWLRINETSGFSAGIYTGSSLIRSDNCLQVGDNGSAFLARSDGYGKFSTHLDIGSKLSLWQDGEGGNIQIMSGNNHTNAWQIDSYNGNLRFFTYRESDGAIQDNYLDQNTGYINLANYAGYTMRWDVTASNPTTTSTDNCTSYFNQPGSHVYWYYSGGLVNGQPSTYGYILDIGSYAERHQIWMTQAGGALFHRGGNNDGWTASGWMEILDSVNYSSYTVPKSGGTFTGNTSISYAHGGGAMLQLISGNSTEASINYGTNGTSYWVVGKGCAGAGNDIFTWFYTPSGYNVMTLTSAGALAVATLNTNAINMNGNVYFHNGGHCYIGNGSSDSSPTVGGDLTNLVISSWFGISFTTSCSSNYQNKTAIGFDCRNGIIRAATVYGAVWNDYAEYRNQAEELKPGQVAYCGNDGKLRRTTKRLQKFEGVVSDTFGFAIGETDNCKTPLAVSGRVLVYTYEDRSTFNSGDCVCAAPNGRVSKMTREEIAYYPDRIVGVVSEIPDYEVWGTGNVNVNNRIWIKVK